MTAEKKTPPNLRANSRGPLPVVGILALVMVASMAYSLFSERRMVKHHVPLTDAASRVTIEVSLGHLWFEEAIGGVRSQNAEVAWEHLDRADWYIRAMLDGGQSSVGLVTPLRSPELRAQIVLVQGSIAEFREIAEDRWRMESGAGIGSPQDESLDAVFKTFLEQADTVETLLHALLAEDEERFHAAQTTAIALSIGIFALIGTILWQSERRKLHDSLLLSESEQRMDLVLRGAELGTWDWNVQTGSVVFNERSAGMLGYGLDEFEPHVNGWKRLLHPDDMPGVMESLDNHLAGRSESFEVEYRLRHKSGEWIWILDNGQVLDRDGDGKALRMCGTHLDHSEFKRSRDALQEKSRVLAERVKEQRCLYSIAESISTCRTVDKIFEAIVKVIPPGWQYPEITVARVCFDSREYRTESFMETPWRQSADIVVAGQTRGSVDVFYLEERPLADDGPFLVEEQRLLDQIVRALGGGIRRSESEQALTDSEQKMRAITNAAQDAIIMMDNRGLVAFWNSAATKIFGWSAEDAADRRLSELIAPMNATDIHPIAFSTLCQSDGDTVPGEIVQIEARHRDGAAIPIELSLSAFKLDGEWCSIGLARDISQRVAVEQSQIRLKAAVEATSEAIVITDIHGVIEYANPAFEQVTGYTQDEAIGGTPRIVNSGTHGSAFYEDLWKTLHRGEVWQGQFINRKKDGTIFYEDATISPIRDGGGRIINYVAVKRDVTSQRILNMQRQQAQKLESIGQLAAGIAHEINTPTQYVGDNTRFVRNGLRDLLSIVDKYATLLAPARENNVPTELVENIETAIEALDLEFIKKEIPRAIDQTLVGVDRISKIIHAMKEFSHPGKEGKTPSDLNRAIESTLTICRNRWKYVAELKVDFESDLPLVPCLVGEFNQVILNIIVNAADAIADVTRDGGRRKGTITVKTRTDGDSVEIRIADTGPGIPEEIQSKIFDPFFTTKEIGKGTGQGLAISRDVIVNKHGGSIYLESVPGEGTVFIIRLPVADGSATERRSAA